MKLIMENFRNYIKEEEGDTRMKITKARLENLIREEMKVIEEDDSLTPEEQTVARLMNELTTAIEDMGQSNVAPSNVAPRDYYFELAGSVVEFVEHLEVLTNMWVAMGEKQRETKRNKEKWKIGDI